MEIIISIIANILWAKDLRKQFLNANCDFEKCMVILQKVISTSESTMCYDNASVYVGRMVVCFSALGFVVGKNILNSNIKNVA